MTREEAMTIIDNLHLIGCGRNQHEDDLRINVALDMAIEALNREQQIIENGYTGKEMRIRIGGKLFAVRELAQ